MKHHSTVDVAQAAGRCLCVRLLILSLPLFIGITEASGTPIVIDDFSAPVPAIPYAISLTAVDPLLIEFIDPAVLGGERDLLVDVDGVPGPVSATGTVGEGSYLFGSAGAGVSATLQYDGIDLDIVGPPAQLLNSEGLGGFDLINSTNTGILLEFASIDGGAGTVLGVVIAAHGVSGTATYIGDIPENSGPSTYWVPFAAFTVSGTFTFAELTSLEFEFNPNSVRDVDFQLDAITAVPEPLAVVMLAVGALAVLPRHCRRDRTATAT